jgi:maltodextrin utilization protein YvdJ
MSVQSEKEVRIMVKNAKTIDEYKKMKKVEDWINKNFVENSVKYEIDGDTVKITDNTGDSMILALKDME